MNLIDRWILNSINLTDIDHTNIPKVKWWCYINNKLLGVVETRPPTEGDILWLVGKFHTYYPDRFQARRALEEFYDSAINLDKHCTATMYQQNIRG